MTVVIDVRHGIGSLTKEGVYVVVIYLLVLYTTSKIEYNKSDREFRYSERGKSVTLSLECCFLYQGAVVSRAGFIRTILEV